MVNKSISSCGFLIQHDNKLPLTTKPCAFIARKRPVLPSGKVLGIKKFFLKFQLSVSLAKYQGKSVFGDFDFIIVFGYFVVCRQKWSNSQILTENYNFSQESENTQNVATVPSISLPALSFHMCLDHVTWPNGHLD